MNRRQLAAFAVGSGASLLMQSSSIAIQATPESSTSNGLQADGSWSFVDDRGRTVVQDHLPTRIFADIQAGLSLFAFGIKPIGMIGYAGVYDVPEELADVPFLDLDASGGTVDIEAILGLAPDLLLGISWTAESESDWGGIDETSIPGFTDIAPTLAILGVVQSADVSVARFAELAEALGGDIATPEILEAQATYDAAVQAVQDAVAAKPGLTVLAISPTPDLLYLGNPQIASDLVFFAELGVQFIVPDSPDESVYSGLWQELSWEQVLSYQADLYLNDDRPYSLSDEDLLAHPTFSLLPAAAAGQISSWTVEYITTYAGLAPVLQTLADAINSAEVVS